MAERALIIGGTGPTGIPIVQGLIERGYDVSLLHRGLHERAETPAEVHHLHHDPYDEVDLGAALEDTTFDVVVAMYGRLRRIAELTVGRTGASCRSAGCPPTAGG